MILRTNFQTFKSQYIPVKVFMIYIRQTENKIIDIKKYVIWMVELAFDLSEFFQTENF